jgi:PIN domain nuclease of toxin-antitoxin system
VTDVVLDASALLALLLDEPGGDKVKAMLDGALLGAMNLAEIVSHYAKLGAARSDIEALLRPLPVRVVPIDERLSYDAGMLRPLTLKAGLSLGDRYCLALAKREGVPAVTAERRWPDIAATAGVTVDLIR